MKPYYQEPDATLYQGHALDILKDLLPGSVDCVPTSPPFWGLRTYKTEPQIWDGDNHCEHEWVTEQFKQHSGRGDCQSSKKYSEQAPVPDMELKRGFCLKCGAWKGELGLEPTIELYISHLLQIFDEVKRVLKKTGTLRVNIGDSYAGSGSPGGDFRDGKGGDDYLRPYNRKSLPAKSLCLIPERFAIGMVERGWILRNNIIWYKPNPMPESVKDRFTGSYEYLYFFTKSRRYWFEQQFEPNLPQSIKRDQQGYDGCFKGRYTMPDEKREECKDQSYLNPLGRNKRDVWEINTQPYPEAHFAVFPEKLVETPILAGCPQDGVVMDIFAGSGTTGAVAKRLGRKYIGIELSQAYCKLHIKRLQGIPLAMGIA